MGYIKNILKTGLILYLGFKLGYGCAKELGKKDAFHKSYYQTLEDKLR